MSKRERQDVHGIVLLDKPAGMSSNHALQRVKRLLNARKAGHSGSLDPLATGMLPICLGEATRFSQYLLDADKQYEVTAVLGARSTTGDGEGELLDQQTPPVFTKAQWQGIADRFLGDIEQVPPMYSALKHDGKRLYELARRGQDVERPPRRVRIAQFDVLEVAESRLKLRVTCSKGTYIRTLVEDLAAAAGTVGWTEALRRTRVWPFEQPMIDLDALNAMVEADSGASDALLPVDAGLTSLERVSLDSRASLAFCEGQPVELDAQPGRCRVYAEQGCMLGIAEIGAEGELLTRKVLPSGRKVVSEAAMGGFTTD